MLDKAPIRIKEGRNKIGLSQEKLGKIVHVTKQSVSKWENGENLPEPPTMNKLADIFGYSVDYLYGRIDDPNPYTSTVNEKITADSVEEVSKSITDDFIDLLLKHKWIKSADELTPGKIVMFLNKIFNEKDTV